MEVRHNGKVYERSCAIQNETNISIGMYTTEITYRRVYVGYSAAETHPRLIILVWAKVLRAQLLYLFQESFYCTF